MTKRKEGKDSKIILKLIEKIYCLKTWKLFIWYWLGNSLSWSSSHHKTISECLVDESDQPYETYNLDTLLTRPSIVEVEYQSLETVVKWPN